MGMSFIPCPGRDVRPNKTTQHSLIPLAPFWEKRGAYSTSGVDVRGRRAALLKYNSRTERGYREMGSTADVLFGFDSVPEGESNRLSMDGYEGLNSRANKINLRHTQKGEGIFWAPRRPVMANTYWRPQYGNPGRSEYRRVRPDIQNEIDPALIENFFKNPYTVPINPYVRCS